MRIRQLKSEKKEEEKKEQEKVEKKANKDVWICEKCNEENEDSFESCWKCQTESDIGLKKSKIYHTLLNDENKKEYEEKKKESLIYEKVNKFTLKDILSLSMDFYS